MHSVSGGGKEFSTAWRGTADESCANAEFAMHGVASSRNARGTSYLQLLLCGRSYRRLQHLPLPPVVFIDAFRFLRSIPVLHTPSQYLQHLPQCAPDKLVYFIPRAGARYLKDSMSLHVRHMAERDALSSRPAVVKWK